jgi:hypothetical protein
MSFASSADITNPAEPHKPTENLLSKKILAQRAGKLCSGACLKASLNPKRDEEMPSLRGEREPPHMNSCRKMLHLLVSLIAALQLGCGPSSKTLNREVIDKYKQERALLEQLAAMAVTDRDLLSIDRYGVDMFSESGPSLPPDRVEKYQSILAQLGAESLHTHREGDAVTMVAICYRIRGISVSHAIWGWVYVPDHRSPLGHYSNSRIVSSIESASMEGAKTGDETLLQKLGDNWYAFYERIE